MKCYNALFTQHPKEPVCINNYNSISNGSELLVVGQIKKIIIIDETYFICSRNILIKGFHMGHRKLKSHSLPTHFKKQDNL